MSRRQRKLPKLKQKEMLRMKKARAADKQKKYDDEKQAAFNIEQIKN